MTEGWSVEWSEAFPSLSMVLGTQSGLFVGAGLDVIPGSGWGTNMGAVNAREAVRRVHPGSEARSSRRYRIPCARG